MAKELKSLKGAKLKNIILSSNPCPICVDASRQLPMTKSNWKISRWGLTDSKKRYCNLKANSCHCILIPPELIDELPAIDKKTNLRGDPDSDVRKIIEIGPNENRLKIAMDKYNLEIGKLPNEIYDMPLEDVADYLEKILKGGPTGGMPWKSAKTMAEATKWGDQFGIDILHQAGKKVDLKYVNLINEQISKIPRNILLKIKANKGRLQVVADSGITVHPTYSYLKGQKPRGWTTGTWDTVPGAGGTIDTPISVIVGNRMDVGHGAFNLVLHEYGHTVDAILKAGPKKLSDLNKWQSIWKTNKAKGLITNSYHEAYAEEYWAQAFAKYFDTPGAHGYLPNNVMKYFDDLVKEFK